LDKPRVEDLEIKLVRLKVALFLLGAPLALLFLIFGLPIVGSAAALNLAHELGCTVNAASAHTCLLFGTDIGDILYNYAMTSLFLGVLNPLLFFLLLVTVISQVVAIAWFVAVLALLILIRDVKRQLSGN
jgi:hypothetical protein